MFDPNLYTQLSKRIHIHILSSDEDVEESVLQYYESLLSSEEKARKNRYKFAVHQRQFLLTRALVRTLLSRYIDIPPRMWAFEQNEYGRPHIASSLKTPPLRFNLSHTDGFIVCAIADNIDIGVDVEKTTRVKDPMGIADRFFSPHEIDCLHELRTDEEKRHRFFQYWTLGEAYIKARGMGLAIPLAEFTYHIQPNAPISISFGDDIEDSPQAWQFMQRALSPHHLLALAVKRGDNQPNFEIETFPFVHFSDK